MSIARAETVKMGGQAIPVQSRFWELNRVTNRKVNAVQIS
jgi:hypothetical protein